MTSAVGDPVAAAMIQYAAGIAGITIKFARDDAIFIPASERGAETAH